MNEQQAVLATLALFAVAFLIFKSMQKGSSEAAPTPTAPMAAESWDLGPSDYPGGNPAAGVPLHPLPHPDGLLVPIPFPNAAAGHVHYVTRRQDEPLTGKTGIELYGRLEAEPWVEFAPTKFKPPVPAMLTVYLRRKGDTYTKGYELFRWFCTSATITPLRAGEFVIRAPLSDRWTPADGLEDSVSASADFAAALADPHSIGFVLGGGDGYGHGIYATGPAGLVIYECKVV